MDSAGTTSSVRTAAGALEFLQRVVQRNPHIPVRLEIAASYHSGSPAEQQGMWNLGDEPEVQKDGVTPGAPVTRDEGPYRTFFGSVNAVYQVFAEDRRAHLSDRKLRDSRIIDAILFIGWNVRPAVSWHSKVNAMSALLFILEKITDRAAWGIVDQEVSIELEMEKTLQTCTKAIMKTLLEVLGTMSETGVVSATKDNVIEVPESLQTYLRRDSDMFAGKTSALGFVEACEHRWEVQGAVGGQPAFEVEELRAFFR